VRLTSEARVLLSLVRGLPSGRSHADALAGFYGPQAQRYDAFRERLLHGRDELIQRLGLRPGDRVVDVGGGTARNLEYFGAQLSTLAAVDLVDLCQPLLDVAATRTAGMGDVRLVTADAATYRPDQPADCVYFSYSLTMIPNWCAAVDNAVAMLRPGGTIGVVDFYVSPPHPAAGLARHGWPTRTLWPAWFRHDGVHLSPDHLPYLRRCVATLHLGERRAGLPYVPLATVPYYLFIGRKP
jgi:S-adenosylmethionine-diacylgycerolhomoserine-N-methlytransferase